MKHCRHRRVALCGTLDVEMAPVGASSMQLIIFPPRRLLIAQPCKALNLASGDAEHHIHRSDEIAGHDATEAFHLHGRMNTAIYGDVDRVKAIVSNGGSALTDGSQIIPGPPTTMIATKVADEADN